MEVCLRDPTGDVGACVPQDGGVEGGMRSAGRVRGGVHRPPLGGADGAAIGSVGHELRHRGAVVPGQHGAVCGAQHLLPGDNARRGVAGERARQRSAQRHGQSRKINEQMITKV
eukprot:5463289-Pyramimonas_sp.AAC.2